MSRLPKMAMAFLGTLLIVSLVAFFLTTRRIERQRDAVLADRIRILDALREEQRRLAADLEQIPAAPAHDQPMSPASLPADSMTLARETAQLIKSGLLGQMFWPGATPLAAISEFATFVGANEAETAALRQAVESAGQQIAAFAIASASVHRTGNQFVIATKDSPAAQQRYEQMLGSLSQILGPERYAFHETLGVKIAVERMLKKDGMVGSTLVITKDFDARRQIDVYEISSMHRNGEGISGGMSREALKSNLASLHALVPADF